MTFSIAVFSGALYILVISSLFIGVFSYRKFMENKTIDYYDTFIENGLVGKKYL